MGNKDKNKEGKRKRGDNWVKEDKILLKELVKERLEDIENKKTDTGTNQKKKKAWLDLQDCFNESCSGEARTVTQLKSQWTLTKILARKEKGDNWINELKSGGETPSSDTSLAVNENIWLSNEFIKCEADDSDDSPEEDTLNTDNNIYIENKRKLDELDLECRQELHQLQVENERKRARNLDLEQELIRTQILYYKNKTPENKSNMSSSNYKLTEVEGDLFSAPKNYSLAHCVAADLGMGAGIAVKFKQIYGQIDELRSQQVQTGGVAILKDDERYIYYLVTKPQSWGSPTYENLRASLNAMREHMRSNNVHKLAIPRIGCGIDGLEWDKVSAELNGVFSNEDLEIVVYNFVPK